MNKKDKLCITSGLLIGAINGLFGGGGGMVAVPVLQRGLNYNSKEAHATAIYIIAPVCIAGAIAYIVGGFAKLNLIIPVSAGSVVGGLTGALSLKKMPTVWVDAIFIAVMLAAGIKMLI
jgi:hypothetical protein